MIEGQLFTSEESIASRKKKKITWTVKSPNFTLRKRNCLMLVAEAQLSMEQAGGILLCWMTRKKFQIA